MSDKPIRIQSPCSKRWSDLVPHGPGRHCAECQEIVHDAAALTSRELDELLTEVPNPCLRVVLLPDGTALTRDRIRLTDRPRPSHIVAAALAALSLSCGEVKPGAGSPPGDSAKGSHTPAGAEEACTTPAPPEEVARVAGTTDPVELTPEMLEMLASLGYVE